jgi:hypothetical protein
VEWSQVEKGVEALRRANADVTVDRLPMGTHFLLFAHTEAVVNRLAEWAAGGAGEGSPPAASG